MAAIDIQHLSKVFPNGAQALRDIDLHMPAGSFTVLVGPSGCGKSTLLRMIAGLDHASSGDVAIAGQTMRGVDPSARDVAMVFQNYALYPHMSVRDNLSYGLKNRRTPKQEIARRVQHAADILRLSALLDRRPAQLSGGQRQRVAMGRAIVREPVCFLFDEPLSNLDAQLRVDMRYEIRQLHQRLGRTTVYVTHDQAEAMTLADQVVVMNQGRIEQVGTPLQVYHQPASVFVAGFMGAPAINTWAARQTATGFDCDGWHLTTAVPQASAPSVTLGLRSEHLTLTPPAHGRSTALTMHTVMVEELGNHRLMHAMHHEQRWVVSLPLDVAVPEQQFTVHLDHDRLHVFDADSGQRLKSPTTDVAHA